MLTERIDSCDSLLPSFGVARRERKQSKNFGSKTTLITIQQNAITAASSTKEVTECRPHQTSVELYKDDFFRGEIE